jgi:hypothetical protein
MKFIERLTTIDRRIIYLVLAIVVLIPLISRSPEISDMLLKTCLSSNQWDLRSCAMLLKKG